MISFMTFNLLTIPCFASVATAKSELASKKDFWGTVAFWLGVSYVVSAFLYISIDYVWTLAITLPVAAGGVVGLYFYDRHKKKEEAKEA